LHRTLGESIDIGIVVAPDLWNVRVDPGQLENALINLAINARDAMPSGGRLEVTAQNHAIDAAFCAEHPETRPGDYVSISVMDTGCGIPADVLARVFEPFFTTKEHGKGSGLGLPMVHGFAEQSGGTATITSEVDHGTKVTLLLPRSAAEHVPAHDDTIVQQIVPGGHETILVVEDDPDLRETVVTALRQLGYQTLEAASGPDALAMLAGIARVDLLFTDIMMPGGMLGPALAQKARESRPGLSVLFTTGYAERGVLASGDGVAASDVIAKPYRNEELARRIRQVLDREMCVV
jgi:CheY-like chemotaxis protein